METETDGRFWLRRNLFVVLTVPGVGLGLVLGTWGEEMEVEEKLVQSGT